MTLSIAETTQAIREGHTTAEAIVRAQLDKIGRTDGDIQAWHHVARESAMAAARHTDNNAPLAGITIGIKDVFDTADMPTGYGSKIYDGTQPKWDAPIITAARQAGAIMLGKTVTTEFAMSSPGKTRNPHNLAHTPGGSSSGSCAAVAAGHVHAAFGTQTSGSTIRPSSYCGVTGYKPSFGLLNRAGIKPLSESLDTVGLITRTAADAAHLAAILAERPALATAVAPRNLRVGLFLGSHAADALPETHAALARAAQAIERAGGTIRQIQVRENFHSLYAHHDAIMGWETPRTLAYERAHLAPHLTQTTKDFLAQLATATLAQYEAALEALQNRAEILNTLFDGVDILLTPAAPGEAPEGLTTTGDPVFNKIWTLLHAPAITIPTHRGPKNVPVGIQLVARLNDDNSLLAAAKQIEKIVGRVSEVRVSEVPLATASQIR